MKSQEELETERITLKETKKKFNELTVFLDEDDAKKTATLFLRKPDKHVRSLISTILSRPGQGSKAVEAVLRNLYIGGDNIDEVCKNDYAIASADEAVVEMLQVHKAVLKKN